MDGRREPADEFAHRTPIQLTPPWADQTVYQTPDGCDLIVLEDPGEHWKPLVTCFCKARGVRHVSVVRDDADVDKKGVLSRTEGPVRGVVVSVARGFDSFQFRRTVGTILHSKRSFRLLVFVVVGHLDQIPPGDRNIVNQLFKTRDGRTPVRYPMPAGWGRPA